MTFNRFLFLGIVLGLVTPSLSQDNPNLPYDTQAVFKTHVPHANSVAHGSGGNGASTSNSATVVFGGAPYTVGATVACTTSVPEAEQHIAVDPNNSSNLIAAISDFALRGGSNTTKYAFSTNNGASWAQSYVPLVSGAPATSDGQVWPYNSDPVAAIDKLGNVYLTDLYFHSEAGNKANGIYVCVGSVGGGANFTVATTYPVSTQLDPATTVTEDKEWLAVDNSASAFSGNVYISWTRFVGNSDMIMLSRSVNHGVTWSAPIQLSPSVQNGAVQGSQVAVGPGGEVYVVYEVFFIGGKRQQFMAKSTNGGVSFSTAAAITPQFNELSFNSTYRKSSFSALAVSSTNGDVYVVYPDFPSKTLGAQAEFIRSTNGGASFSAPLAINDNSNGQQFMPAVTVDGAGTIHACWFDTRNSSSNSVYDIYAARSLDRGGTFSPNARVTATSVSAGNSNFIGDYTGVAAGGGFAHPVWNSGGFNGGLLKTATLQ